MLTAIATVVGALAAGAAVFAFGLSVTRTSRLRRREQFYREAANALSPGPGDEASSVIADLHRVAVSELVAREVTSPWRVVAPWAAWALVAVLAGQAGYLASGYVATDDSWAWTEFLIEVFGDPMAWITVPWFLLAFLPFLCQAQVHTLTSRAKAARDFYDGQAVTAPVGVLAFDATAVSADVKRTATSRTPSASSRSGRGPLKRHLLALPPGLLSTALGLNVGSNVWVYRQPGERLQTVELLGSMPAFEALALALAATAMLPTYAWYRDEIAPFALPRSFPGRSVPADEVTPPSQQAPRQSLRPRRRFSISFGRPPIS